MGKQYNLHAYLSTHSFTFLFTYLTSIIIYLLTKYPFTSHITSSPTNTLHPKEAPAARFALQRDRASGLDGAGEFGPEEPMQSAGDHGRAAAAKQWEYSQGTNRVIRCIKSNPQQNW